jgi:hypothetical protein
MYGHNKNVHHINREAVFFIRILFATHLHYNISKKSELKKSKPL